jgi:glycine cleavage system H protein
MPTRVPEELRYTQDHEWVRAEGDQLTVGITDHAQSELTDVVFVDLPAKGKTLGEHDVALTLESVKTVAEVYSPAAGTLTEANPDLRTHPEYVNQDPYGKGWIFRMKPSTAPAGLLSAAEYRKLLETSAHS